MIKACFIYARLDSKRLPRKALLKIGDKKLIEYAIDAAKKVVGSETILLTSDRTVDDELEDIAYENEIICFRGDALNVAKRTYDCIKQFEIDFFARINGDSPFTQSSLLNEGFKFVNEHRFIDLYSNLIERTMPYGVSVEIVSCASFVTNYKNIQKSELYQEHITSIYYDNIDKYNVRSRKDNTDNTCVSLTVDTQSDLLQLQEKLCEYPNLFILPIEEVIEIYKKPERKF